MCRQQFFNSSFLQDTFNDGSQIKCFMSVEVNGESICLTSLTRAKCDVPSTLCWEIPNISGSIELFAL